MQLVRKVALGLRMNLHVLIGWLNELPSFPVAVDYKWRPQTNLQSVSLDLVFDIHKATNDRVTNCSYLH